MQSESASRRAAITVLFGSARTHLYPHPVTPLALLLRVELVLLLQLPLPQLPLQELLLQELLLLQAAVLLRAPQPLPLLRLLQQRSVVSRARRNRQKRKVAACTPITRTTGQ